MEYTLPAAGVIALMGLICVIRFPEGIPNTGKKTDGFWVFITADIIALCISKLVMIVEMSVDPKTWNKIEEHAKKAMYIATIFEMIAIHQIGLILVCENFWERLIFKCFGIGLIGLACVTFIVVVVNECGVDQSETGGLAAENNQV